MRPRFLAPLALLLASCANFNATLDTALAVWGPPPARLVPGFEYLEVSVGSHRTVMALGKREQTGGAWLEQWFSGQGEMLELRDGRIHRALGMTHEVRETRAKPPAWDSRPALAAPGMAWSRQRQVMPGYQLRLEEVRSQDISPPDAGPFAEAQWVQEEVRTRVLGGPAWQYTERFALREGRVVYSEQCIHPELCFRLRPMGVAP